MGHVSALFEHADAFKGKNARFDLAVLQLSRIGSNNVCEGQNENQRNRIRRDSRHGH